MILAAIADIGIAIATVAAINIPATFLIFFIIIFPFFLEKFPFWIINFLLFFIRCGAGCPAVFITIVFTVKYYSSRLRFNVRLNCMPAYNTDVIITDHPTRRI